ncbi:uncharacterized protein YbjT (DUF2867 family) [Devosia sp. UYZn731]|uniref:NAD(P)H-binding protein n=1 Tax=Devosia sp. UYZn731 TaxID=3156345 RepID=UPI003391CC1F
MSKTILVLGATGKIGRRLLPILKQQHAAEVRAASRSASAGYIPFDWHNPQSWTSAVTGTDAVFLIGPEMVEDPSDQIGALLDLASKHGVTNVVAVSSLGVTFPNEPANSGRLKVEAGIKASGLTWTILRPGGFHQNFSEGFFAPGIQAGMVQTATGSGKAAFIDAGDIAAVAAIALSGTGHEGQIYALTGPQALSFPEAVEIVGAAMGRKLAYSALPEDAFRAMMIGFGLPAGFADVVVRDQIAIRDGYAADTTATVAEITGKPAVSFAEYAATAFHRAD